MCQFLFLHYPIYHYNCIVQIPSFDKVGFVKHLEFMQKTKGSTRSYFWSKLTDVSYRGMLTTKYW